MVSGTHDIAHTRLQLLTQQGVIEVPSDQHELVFAFAGPVGVVNGKALAREVEHMPPFALVEPEDALGPEHLAGELIVQKVLEFAQSEGSVAAE